MSRYITTNLRFTAETYRELRYRAARRGVALASVVREAVDGYLGRVAGNAALPLGDDPADSLIGCVEVSGGDESVNHDHYLYGWPKEAERDSSWPTRARSWRSRSATTGTTRRRRHSPGKARRRGSS